MLSCIECDVKTAGFNEELWGIIMEKVTALAESLNIEDISQIPAISASRKAYKACGKAPARYRLSAEALLRRIVNRGEIYQINNVVDLLNLVSVTTGYSIGGYDAEKISGKILFGIGSAGEPYTGIGRGVLNIENMPVFRDEIGAFGTSTSDAKRTCVTPETGKFLMIIVDYQFDADHLAKATELATGFLEKYAGAKNIEKKIVS
ncbi:MAG: hypothetical protein CR996_00190 [Draconibacterium sp.]|nr:MAG: hypothetical protein CR996_00190 [Draconibacterium sp.]PIF06493.1 MAG: hypothetical protein CSA36_01370 [Draconibacterium sp.]